MPKSEKTKAGATCGEADSCCKVEAVVSVDARGQIVLPKDVREKAGIKAGDKLAVIAFESNGEICCISLVKSDAFAETVKDMLGPMMSGILQG